MSLTTSLKTHKKGIEEGIIRCDETREEGMMRGYIRHYPLPCSLSPSPSLICTISHPDDEGSTYETHRQHLRGEKSVWVNKCPLVDAD